MIERFLIVVLLALLVVALAACPALETRPNGAPLKDKVTRLIMFSTVEELRDPRWCGPDVLGNVGCWRTIDARGGCEIIVVEPRDTDDAEALQTLGKEVFKCFTDNKEY